MKEPDITERHRRETIELLVGANLILIFAIALVTWPNFADFIGDVADELLQAACSAVNFCIGNPRR
jgi:hypothetical protein